MTQFILTVEGDHAKLTADGLVVYESSIGSKPVEPVPPNPNPPPVVIPTIPPRSTVNYSLYMGETRAQAEWLQRDKMVPGWNWDDFAASGFMGGVEEPVTDQDKRSIRDLSLIEGPAVVEGYAGTVDYILCRRPVGEIVEVTTGRTNSGLGAITLASLSVATAEIISYDPPQGSDCYGKIKFKSTGNDSVRVELHADGALAVQRNVGIRR